MYVCIYLYRYLGPYVVLGFAALSCAPQPPPPLAPHGVPRGLEMVELHLELEEAAVASLSECDSALSKPPNNLSSETAGAGPLPGFHCWGASERARVCLHVRASIM